MTSIEAFNNAAKKCTRRQGLWVLAGFVQLFVVIGLMALAMDNRADLLFNPILWPIIRAGVGFASFLALLYCILRTRRVDRDFPGARCPHCNTWLGAGVHQWIVVATRNCTNCGRRVLAEPTDIAAVST